MSEFSVHRTADRIPALRYCLVLDGTRIAGGKPDYRGDNHLINWQTDETYGPVDDLMAENAALRELARQMHTCLTRPKAYTGASQPYLVATKCPYFTQGVCDYNSCGFEQRMSELGIEVTE